MHVRYEKEECPFCHSHDVVVKHWGREDLKFVNCRSCKACGPAKKYTEDAVNAWNAAKKRVDALPVREGNIDKHRCSGCGKEIVVCMTKGVSHRFCPGCGGEINQPKLF